MDELNVIVVGAGVAGTTAAIALRRMGAHVTVYETRPDPGGDVGSFVSLAANGLRGLDLLGCLDPVREAGFEVDRQRVWSTSGAFLGDVPRGRLDDDPMRGVTIMRGRLVRALRAQAVRDGVSIVTGRRLTDVTETADGVTGHFTDGSRAHADLLVGADGIWSTTRRLLDSRAPSPRYAGLYTVSGTSSGVETDPAAFHMVLARAGAFLHVRTPDGEVWWSAQIAAPEEPDRQAPDGERLRDVAERFRHEAVPSAVIAAATHLHPTTLAHTLDPVPVWHRERTVLIGDAAHPVGAGQGASMAVEDALVLARCLREGTDVAPALASYAAERRPRISRLLDTAEDNRDLKTAGPVRRWVEARAMKVFFRFFYARATAWLYTYDPDPRGSVSAPRSTT